MTEITLSNETVQYINMASKYSKAHIMDCMVEEDRIIFVVEKGQLGIAIGVKAKNLERLRTLFKKNVKFVEFDNDKKKFIYNLCKPYKINNVIIDENVVPIRPLTDFPRLIRCVERDPLMRKPVNFLHGKRVIPKCTGKTFAPGRTQVYGKQSSRGHSCFLSL